MRDDIARAQLTILQLADSALPTGAFAHSFGLETAIAGGLVTDEESFALWLRTYIQQLAYTEGVAVRLAAEASTEQELLSVDALIHAFTIPQQVRAAASAMGERMVAIARIVVPDAPLLGVYAELLAQHTTQGHPAIAYGVALAARGVDIPTIVRTYLMQAATSLTQNAIRGIPLGQNAGQRVLAHSHPVIEEAVHAALSMKEWDIGALSPGLEFAQMAHETQRARMFMS